MVFVLSVTELHTLKRSADKNSDAVGVVSWGFHFGDHDHGGWSQQRPPPLPPPPTQARCSLSVCPGVSGRPVLSHTADTHYLQSRGEGGPAAAGTHTAPRWK